MRAWGHQVSQGRPHPQGSFRPAAPTLVWEQGGWGSGSPGLTGWRVLGRFLRCWGLSSEGMGGPHGTEEPTGKGNEVQRRRAAVSAPDSSSIVRPGSLCRAALLLLAPWTSLGSPTLQPHFLLHSLPEAPCLSSLGSVLVVFLAGNTPPRPAPPISKQHRECGSCCPHPFLLGKTPGHLRALGCDSGSAARPPGSCWIGAAPLCWGGRTCIPGISLRIQQDWLGQHVFQDSPSPVLCPAY